MQVEGQRGGSLLSPPATGARVSNTYATCPCQGDNPPKGGLNSVHATGASRRQERLQAGQGMGMRRIRQ